MLLSYFLEIKNRILLLFITWISTFCICYKYKITLLFFFINPSLVSLQINSAYFISTNLIEIFYIYVKLSSFISTQITLLFFFYHVLLFTSPGIFYFEYKKLLNIFICINFFWLIIILMLYYVLLPWSWRFFLGFQQISTNQNINIYFEAKLLEYYEFFFSLYYICNVICQIIIVLFLYLINLKENIKFIKIYRKKLFFLFFLIASFITPPDIISQIVISLFIIFLYEIMLFVVFVNNTSIIYFIKKNINN